MASTALALPQLDHIIRAASELTERIAEWKAKGYHVLSPAHQMTAFPPNYGVIATGMVISIDPGAKECYSDGTLVRPGDRALSRVGLQKVEQLAGISWLPQSHRTDTRLIPHFWEYESWLALMGYDGAFRTVKGTAEVDLRDGSAQIGGWTPDEWAKLLRATEPRQHRDLKINGWSEPRVRQARQFGLRLAETKSQSAGVRAALGLKPAYSLEELGKPFIVLKVTYLPDMSDALARQLQAERASQGIAALYAAGPTVVPFRGLPAASPSMVDEVEFQAFNAPEPVVVEGLRAAPAPVAPPPAPPPVPAAPPAPPAPAAPVAPVALPPDAVFVESYRETSFAKRDGSGVTKATVVLSDGRELVTVYGRFRDLLRAAAQARTPLIIHDQRSAYMPRDGRPPDREVKHIDAVGAPQDRPLPGIDPEQPIKL